MSGSASSFICVHCQALRLQSWSLFPTQWGVTCFPQVQAWYSEEEATVAKASTPMSLPCGGEECKHTHRDNNGGGPHGGKSAEHGATFL